MQRKCSHSLFKEGLDLVLIHLVKPSSTSDSDILPSTHLSKANFRAIYRIPILISAFFSECVDLWFVSLHRDCPEFDTQSSEFLWRYWTRWNVVVRKALVAWKVIVIVGTHDEGCRGNGREQTRSYDESDCSDSDSRSPLISHVMMV